MKTWKELLSRRFKDVGDEYGPRSQEVWCVFAAIGDAPWFESVGAAISSPSSEIVVVKSWDDALAVCDHLDGRTYGPNGHLTAATAEVWAKLEASNRRKSWEAARAEANDHTTYSAYIPEELERKRLKLRTDRNHREAVEEYVYEFISLALAEVMVSDLTASTYFREQLQWFAAGHLPCGWDGDWPIGKMRVY